MLVAFRLFGDIAGFIKIGKIEWQQFFSCQFLQGIVLYSYLMSRLYRVVIIIFINSDVKLSQLSDGKIIPFHFS